MVLLEIICALIVVTYLVLRLGPSEGRSLAALRLVSIAVSSFLAEDSVIRAYGFYAYEPTWHFFVDRVPILIVCIWPVVIDSAWQVAARIAAKESQPVAWIAALVVLVDASLIEPVAVHAKLWHWTEPGVFHVPPIGIVGWALFTFAFVGASTSARGEPSLLRRLAPVLAAPVAVHGMLLVLWWAAFRWVAGAVADERAAALAYVVLLPTAVALASRGYGRQVPRKLLMLRLPGAAFFFVLLALYARGALPLIAYAIAFVPPYLALMVRRPVAASPNGREAATGDRERPGSGPRGR